MTAVDVRYPDLNAEVWRSHSSQETWPWVPVEAGLVVGQGALPIGEAEYAVPGSGVIYVSPSGSNSNAGTSIGAPVQTFANAVSKVEANGTIVLREGVYHEGAVFTATTNAASQGYTAIVVSTAGVTVQNYPGEAVWFDGSEIVPTEDWTADGGTWRCSHTAFRRDLTSPWASSYPPADNDWESLDNDEQFWTYVNYEDYPCANWPEQLWVRPKGHGEDAWVAYDHVPLLGDIGAGKFYVDAYNDRVHIPVDPADFDVRLTKKQTLMNGLATGFTLRGIGVRRYGTTLVQTGVVKLHRPDGVIENCVFEDLSGKAVSILGDPNTTNGSNDSRLGFCTFRRSGNLDLHVDQVDDLLFHDNRFEYGNSRRYNWAPDAGAVKVHRSRGVTSLRNLYWYPFGKGFWADVDVNGVVQANCDFVGCEQRGAVYELCRNVVDVGSRHVDGGAEAIVSMDSEDVQVWNASFYNIGLIRGTSFLGDTVLCAGIHFMLTQRAGANSSGNSRFSYHDSSGRLLAWPTAMAIRYVPYGLVVKNCVFGPSNYWTYMGLRFNGPHATDGGSVTARPWTDDDVNWDHNYYNGHSSKQTLSRQYPWFLRNGTDPSEVAVNIIATAISNLRSQTTANPQEANGTEVTDVDRCTTDGFLKSEYQAAANAIAEPIPESIADLLGVEVNAQLMGPRVRG